MGWTTRASPPGSIRTSAASCGADAACKAYTYVRSGLRPRTRYFLKSAAPPPTSTTAVSRRKISRDVGADADRGLQHRARRDHAGDVASADPELPATTIVRLPNGREMTAANYNKMADTFIAIRKAGLDRAPPPKSAFRVPRDRPGQLRPGMDLRTLVMRPDTDVVQLPTGEKFTVGDLKRLSAIEKAPPVAGCSMRPARVPAWPAPASRSRPASMRPS